MTEEKKEDMAPATAATNPPATKHVSAWEAGRPAQEAAAAQASQAPVAPPSPTTPPGWQYSMGTAAPWGSVPASNIDANKPLQERIVDVMKTVYDPEIPVNIYELGMVYELKADEPSGEVYVKMTLTTPACPVAGSLPPEVERRLRAQAGVKNVKLDLVWEPAWNPQMMSEAAKLKLGFL